MINQFSPLDEIRQERIKHLSGLIDALVQLTELLKSRTYEMGVLGRSTLILYGITTGNQYILTQAYSAEGGTALAEEYQAELQSFVAKHLAKLLSRAIVPIMDFVKVDNNIGKPRLTSIRDIELEEFNIINLCRPYYEYKPNRFADQEIDKANLNNLYSHLDTLLHNFRVSVTRQNNQYSNECVAGKKYFPDDNEEGFMSVKDTLSFTFMIANIAKAIMIGEHRFDDDYTKDRNELDQKLILREFVTISSLGSMSLGNMICCFEDRNLFRAAVDNKDNELGYYEKLLLRNGLAMVTLLSLLS